MCNIICGDEGLTNICVLCIFDAAVFVLETEVSACAGITEINKKTELINESLVKYKTDHL